MLSQSCQVISNTTKCSWSGHIKTFWTPFSVVLFHMDHLKRVQRMNQSRLQHPALRFWMALKLTDTSVWVWTMKQCQRQIYIRERQIGIKREREQEKGENLQRQYLTWPDGRCMQTNHICSYLVCLRATMLMSVCGRFVLLLGHQCVIGTTWLTSTKTSTVYDITGEQEGIVFQWTFEFHSIRISVKFDQISDF